MKKYKLSLFIFRRDLRLDDNTGLIEAMKNSETVMPCFIFDPRQVENHPYRSDHALQFMLESLGDLQGQIGKHEGKMYFFYGEPEQVLAEIFRRGDVQAVFTNRDYTPFSARRDKTIAKLCRKNGIRFHQHADILICEPEQVKNQSGGPYKVFTAFFKKALSLPVRRPEYFKEWNFCLMDIPGIELEAVHEKLDLKINSEIFARGGRAAALKSLKNLAIYKNYDQDRNYPARLGTTGLSAHNKFGVCSIREFFYAVAKQLGEDHTLIAELYWRDFFTHIAFHYPQVFGRCFHEKYEKLRWKNDNDQFHSWCEGQTGFPIVDAGMRELNATGYMHNRVRMIVASFLTKDLHVDWRWGEKYFAQKLLDYDPCVNNGNWQWAASTGCDAQPYFRIFNPWLQQKKFDVDVAYIKKWVPELNKLAPSAIHNWYKEKIRRNNNVNYPEPIVDHAAESKKAKHMFTVLKN